MKSKKRKKRTMISWIGYNQDFKKVQGEGEEEKLEVDFDGPHFSMHCFHADIFDQHIILYRKSELSQQRARVLKEVLDDTSEGKTIVMKEVALDEKGLINIEQIQAKVTPILMEYKDDDLILYVSPGTKAMHTVWHLESLKTTWQSKLIQTRPARFTETGAPELITIDIKSEYGTLAAIASQEEQRSPEEKKRFIKALALKAAYEKAERVALADAVPALILGESGTGKEVLSKYIQEKSPRKKKAFVAINCSSFPDDVLTSELFGHAKGAFTGALKEHKGVFEQAYGGTIFLDEIGDISPKMQQSLLRVIQERKIRPLGSEKEVEVDVRIIAATNKDLLKECAEGRFRWDLYYRLAVVEIELPPLVDWGKEALNELIDFFLELKKKLRDGMRLRLTKAARKTLLAYHFPGNVRELENLISRLYVLVDGTADVKDLSAGILNANQEKPLELKKVMDLVEERHIRRILKQTKHNIKYSAEVMGVAENTLAKKIKHYKIPKPCKCN